MSQCVIYFLELFDSTVIVFALRLCVLPCGLFDSASSKQVPVAESNNAIADPNTPRCQPSSLNTISDHAINAVMLSCCHGIV